MKNTTTILTAAMLFLLASTILGQDDLDKARKVLNSYIEYSKFANDDNFKNFDTSLFAENATIIFDIPFVNDATIKSSFKKYSEQERRRQTSPAIPIFGKVVTPDLYIETLNNAKPQIRNVKFKIDITKTNDSIPGTVIFEIVKSFNSSDRFLESTKKYLVKINTSGQNPKITVIQRNDYNLVKRNVNIQLFIDSKPLIDMEGRTKVTTKKDKSNKDIVEQDTTNNEEIKKDKKDKTSTEKTNITCLLKIVFNETINNNDTIIQSNEGRIRYDLVANRARIKLLSAYDDDSVEYVIPPDWREDGKRVSEQPEDGFEVNLLPKTWNGLAYTIDIHGGIFQQSFGNTGNFQTGSKFINDLGYRVGGEFLVTKYFNPKKWRQSDRVFGIGIGLSISHQWSVTRSDGFEQKKYNYEDLVADSCRIQYGGGNFKETNTRIDFAVPIYFDFRTRISKKASMTIQPGVNVIFPFQVKFNAEGTFSRWGYYDQYNELPITDDPVYNYYTNETKTYSGEGIYSIQMEGQLRLNFLLNVFKNAPDNALVIGLIGTLPLTSTPTYHYGQGVVQDYEGYWINTENDDYHSLMHSKEKPYDFFVGLSVGINLVRFKTR